MARRNFQDLQGETVRLKKYLYGIEANTGLPLD
jgi:hypothetical protein